MIDVTLDVTKGNLVDFHSVMPVIEADDEFRFVVEGWDSEKITSLTFSEFRASNLISPRAPARGEEFKPVKFEKLVGDRSWTISKDEGPRSTEGIRLAKYKKKRRRFIDFTLTIGLADGTSVAVDPPLDERRRRS